MVNSRTTIKKIIALLIFCNVFLLQAQENTPKVSVTISNQPITSIFEIIEIRPANLAHSAAVLSDRHFLK